MERNNYRNRPQLAGKKVLVMGLGSFGGGVGVSRFLVGRGARVTVTDLAAADKLLASIDQLRDLPISFHLEEHREEDIRDADLIVVNPAVKRDSPWLALAREHNIPCTAEMNLFFQFCPAAIIGVTGSNGKSTTTAMTAHILDQAPPGEHGYGKVWLGGNIGQTCLITELDRIAPNDMVVLELSSFQLYDLAQLQRSPHIAVVTNIAPNHLDWHGTMAEYVAAKQHILRFQAGKDHAVLNRLDAEVADWKDLTAAQVHWYPAEPPEQFELALPGEHNQINAAAAVTVGRICGLSEQSCRAALKSFCGLDHRLQLVHEHAGVRYINDSIATTPESTICALDAFAEPKVLILGGYDKGSDFGPLVRALLQADAGIRGVSLIGTMGPKLQEMLLSAAGPSGPGFALANHETLEQSVAWCVEQAQAGDVVLCSPACASYDMFRNFAERGRQFTELAHRAAR